MTKSRRDEKHATETPDVSHVKNIDVTHEQSDVNVGAILTFVAILTAISIVVCFGLYFLFWFYDAREEAKETKTGPMALIKEDRQERYPPEPRLQNAPGFGLKLENGEWINLEKREPAAEYEELRKQWDKTLSEGLKDESGRTIGLPIEEAMKTIVQKSVVPTRNLPGGADTTDSGISIPTSASSGRVSEKLR